MALATIGAILMAWTDPVGHWVYASSFDPMRGQRADIAGLEANSQAALGPPYRGSTRATLTVTRLGDHQVVQVVVENAVGDCSRCPVLVRLNGQPARHWSGTAKPTRGGFVLTLDPPLDDRGQRTFAAPAEISRASDIEVEVPFYAKGAYQYRFVTSAVLHWPNG